MPNFRDFLFSKSQTTSSSRLFLILPLSLIVLCLIPFHQVLTFDFLSLDDDIYILDNPIVSSGLSWSGVKWAFTSLHGGNWHPITSLFMMAEVSLFGVNSMGFHGVNLFFHAINSVLLFMILVRATQLIPPSFFVACLFAVHPTRAESVAWIVELKDILSTLFLFWAIWLYIKHGKASKLSILGVFILSLMSKQMYVTLPALLLVLDYWPLQRFSHEKRSVLVLEKIPYLITGFIASIFAIMAQASCGALKSLDAYPVDLRLKNAVLALVKYITKMFVLFTPSGYYNPYEKAYPLILWLPCLLTIVTITIASYFLRKKHPYLLSGWLLFIISLMPVIGIVQISSQSMGDRFTYFSYIGLSLMVFYFIYAHLSKSKTGRRLFILGGLLFSMVAAVACYIQTSYWKNTKMLLQHAVAVNPKNIFAHLKLGIIFYYDDKNPQEAKPHLIQVLALMPNRPAAHDILGQILSGEGNYTDAEKSFKNAILYAPDNADLITNLATLYATTKKNDLSLIHYKKALQINPDLMEAYSGLLSYGRNTCDFRSIEEYLPRIFSFTNTSPLIASLADWYEKLRGETLVQKEQSCKKIMELEEKQKKELEEVDKILNMTKTLKQISQIPKTQKIY